MPNRDIKDVIQHMKDSLAKGDIKVQVTDGYRYYTDTLTETLDIPITTGEETARLYEKMVMDAKASGPAASSSFQTLPRVSMYVGQPDTGKTYKAQQLAETLGVEHLIIPCRDNLNLETLLEDFKLVDGKPVFQESLAIKMMTDPSGKEYIIILDEFNTLLTGVMKTFQPIWDKTSKTFEYRGKVYHKNLNCKFIVTLNDKDKGISVVPDAILSRCHLTYFDPVHVNTIAKWTNTPVDKVKKLKDIYKILGLLGVFGSRQVDVIKDLTSIDDIKNHLTGLCAMRNVDAKAIETLQVKNLINQL